MGICGCAFCGFALLLDTRDGCCLPKLNYRCTFSTYQFVKDYLLQEQPRKSPKAKAIIQNAPISNIVSQPHVTESYRRPSAKGLVPLEVIRARAREAVKLAKDGFESSFSNQGNFKYTTAPPDDDLVVPTNRRKQMVASDTKSSETSSGESGFALIKSSLAILRDDLQEDLSSTRRPAGGSSSAAQSRSRAERDAEAEGLLGE